MHMQTHINSKQATKVGGVSDIIETHGYMYEYQWVHAPAFECGNIATGRLDQDVRLQRPLSTE